jgi:putative phosphoesterase
MTDSALRVLVLADTHNKLPEKLSSFAEGADEIWHLGDVCDPGIIERIKMFGPPVTIVRGNCDAEFEWPLIVDLVRHGVRLRLVHIPPAPPPDGVDVVLHGHTHVPRNEVVDSVRFLNPGCVTRPNRGAPPSVAILQIGTDSGIDWTLKSLR